MKRAIVLASFGCAAERGRACLSALEQEVQEAFPDVMVRQAYTSAFIKKHLAAANIFVQNLSEALETLLTEGVEIVHLQPSHVMPGAEYRKVCAAAEAYRARFKELTVGKPAISVQEDAEKVLPLILPTFAVEEDEAAVLVGHGSQHEYAAVYDWLQAVLDEKKLPYVIGVLEEGDRPNFDDVMERLNKFGKKKVALYSFLLVGGRHVAEDIGGTGEKSWKSRMEARDYAVRFVEKTLGEIPAFRAHYLTKIKNSIMD